MANAHYLIEISGAGDGREYPLKQPVTSIGRSSDNDIVLDDIKVSRRHARLDVSGDTLSITDLESSNGTMVNGGAITPGTPLPLKENDSVSIGDSTLAVRLARSGETRGVSAESTDVPVSTGYTAPVTSKGGVFTGERITILSAGVLMIVSVFLPWVGASDLMGEGLRAAPGFMVSILAVAAGVVCGAGASAGAFLLKNKKRAFIVLCAGILPLLALTVIIATGTLPLFSEYARTLIVIREGFYVYALDAVVLIVLGAIFMNRAKQNDNV